MQQATHFPEENNTLLKNSLNSSSLLETQLKKFFSQPLKQDVQAMYSISGIIQLCC